MFSEKDGVAGAIEHVTESSHTVAVKGTVGNFRGITVDRYGSSLTGINIREDNSGRAGPALTPARFLTVTGDIVRPCEPNLPPVELSQLTSQAMQIKDRPVMSRVNHSR